MISLRGRLEFDNVTQRWNWRGTWAFGTLQEHEQKLEAQQKVAAAIAAGQRPPVQPGKVGRPSKSLKKNAAPPPAVLPFAYSWERAVHPREVPLPSSQQQQQTETPAAAPEPEAAKDEKDTAAPAATEGLNPESKPPPADASPAAAPASEPASVLNKDASNSAATADAPKEVEKNDSATTTTVVSAEDTTKQSSTNTAKESKSTAAGAPVAAVSAPENKEENEEPDNKGAQEQQQPSQPPPLRTFADPQFAGDPAFTDAVKTAAAAASEDAGQAKCPASGEWKGHFETLASRKNAANLKIYENCFLFFNATPSDNAKVTFESPDTAPAAASTAPAPAPALTASSSAPTATASTGDASVPPAKDAAKDSSAAPPAKQEDPEKLKKGWIHVRGTGTNMYGTFELIGWLELETKTLNCHRMYVPSFNTGAANTRSSAASPAVTRTSRRSSQRQPKDSAAVAAILDDNGRPYQTRKRQMSWKKRDTLMDETAEAATDDTTGEPKTRPFLADGPRPGPGRPPLKKAKSTESYGGATETLLTATGSAGASSVGLSSLSKSPASAGGHKTLPVGSSLMTSAGATGSLLMPITVPQPGAIRQTTSTGSSKQPKHKSQLQQQQLLAKQLKAQQFKQAPQQQQKKRLPTAGAPSAARPAGSTMSAALSGQPVSHVKLPPVGDPMAARWRAAHYLYYHRNDPEDGIGADPNNNNNKSNGNHATAAASSNMNNGSSTPGGANSNANNNNNNNPKYVVYEGEMLHSQRDGRGVCLYSNGLLYEGSWKRDKEHGQGTLMTSDRSRIIYKGDWERGRFHGKGVYYYNSPTKASANNPKKSANNKKAAGAGRTSPSGSALSASRYEGEFRENLRHGNGVYVLNDGGSVYDGQWRDDMMNGRGTFIWPDGSSYDGEWKDGKRHGNGILKVASDGFCYDGQWMHNAMEGRGSATYPNGQHFHGSFAAGRRDGRGTISFTNGAIYEGRFREDAVDGQGTLRLARAMAVPRSAEEDAEEEAAAASSPSAENGKHPTKKKQDFMIPVSFQSDMGHIHRKAGFTVGGE